MREPLGVVKYGISSTCLDLGEQKSFQAVLRFGHS